MKKIHVRVKSSKYPIYVGSNLLQKIQILYKNPGYEETTNYGSQSIFEPKS